LQSKNIETFSYLVFVLLACQAALEGRAVINLQMKNNFGAFIDMNEAIKVNLLVSDMHR
jgi:hypothetical protein